MDTRKHDTIKVFARRLWRRPTSASLVSVVLHIVLGILVWNAVQMPAIFDQFVQQDRAAKPVAERVEYIAITPPVFDTVAAPVPRAARPQPAPSRSAPAAMPPLVAPREVPTSLPPPAVAPERPVTADPGPLRGGTGPTRGVQPNTDDPRVWPYDVEFFYAPKTDKERLDSALLHSIARHLDSLANFAVTPNKFERGDWTVEKGGQKWGVDQQFIRLGKFQIPTALLALLPMNQMQANPISMDRDRNASYMRADIALHAQMAMNEDEFRKAVKAIRDRKERERRAGQRVIAAPGSLTSPGEKPPPPSPGERPPPSPF